jgi:hypothetical protein
MVFEKNRIALCTKTFFLFDFSGNILRTGITITARVSVENTKYSKEDIENTKFNNVTGNARFFPLYPVRKLNSKGNTVKEIRMVDDIPITETNAIDFKAGCFAKISTPVPTIVVIPESKIDVLNDKILSLLNCNFCNNPFVIKML